MRHRKEIAMDEAAARIGGQFLAERNQPLLVPFDHLGQSVDHDQRTHIGMFQHGARGIAKPEAADDDVDIPAIQRGQSQPRQFDLGGGELARHQEFVAELDLENIEARCGRPAAPQAQHAHRGRAKIQFFEIHAHAPDAR